MLEVEVGRPLGSAGLCLSWMLKINLVQIHLCRVLLIDRLNPKEYLIWPRQGVKNPCSVFIRYVYAMRVILIRWDLCVWL